MSNFVSYSNATELMTAIGQKLAALNGAYVVKGNSTFENLPSTLTAAMNGYVYNVTNDFTTTNDFVEGAGKDYPAGTNVVIVNLGDSTTPNMKFDVIGSFVDVEALEDAIADVSAMITGDFDKTQAYAIGDIVVYDGGLYKFTSAHTANDDWDSSEVSATTVIALLQQQNVDLKAYADTVANMIADPFSATTAYAAGDVVTYGNHLYIFSSSHSAGAWTGSDVTEIQVMDYIATLDGRVDTIAADLASAFDASQAYAIGAVVIKDDVLYKFTSAHTAGDPWSSSEVTAVTLASLVQAAEPDELTAAQITALEALL